jgi:hypothetical protein
MHLVAPARRAKSRRRHAKSRHGRAMICIFRLLRVFAASLACAGGLSISQAADTGGWRIVRTPNPAGGAAAVSIMQIADVAKSDLEFAGLTLRCGQSGIEVLVVLTAPLPPREHPRVRAATGPDREDDFVASIVPPGAALLLPEKATALARGAWANAESLTLNIATSDGGPAAIKGVVPLRGLAAALDLLQTKCQAP